MSLLWRSAKKNKLLQQLITNHKRPSPNSNIYSINPARGLLPYLNHKSDAIKGTPLSTFLKHKLSAGMTVEAAIVLPLFICFFVNLSSAIEIIRLHGNLELALWNIGNKMAVYGSMLPWEQEVEDSADWWEQAAGVAFSYLYVKQEIGNFLGETYLEKSPVHNGINGLQFWESDISTKGDVFEIIVTYKISPYGSLAAFHPFRMTNRYYGHLWNGYALPTESDEKTALVYITERGTVYHKDRNCSHIKLSVRETTLQNALSVHNFYGEKYQPCTLCGSTPGGETEQGKDGFMVWITSDGNSIHYNRSCSSLKRTVREVTVNEVAGLKPCSRCGK